MRSDTEPLPKVMPGILLLVAGALYFTALGTCPLLDPDEGRYAEIPREMLESGDFITPHLNYVKYLEKPPLFYWLVAGALALGGEKEKALRAVPALAGLFTVLLVWGLGKRMFGDETGVLGAWVQTTSLLPLIMARLLIIDGLFALTLTATWAAWWMGYSSPTLRAQRGWYLAAWAALGLAVMTKGLAAIILSAGIVVLYLSLQRDLRALGQLFWLPGPLVFLVIALPWHVAAAARNPGFAHFYFIDQHFGRFVGQEHVKPPWFFLPIAVLGLGAWGALAVPAWAQPLRHMAATLRTGVRDGPGEQTSGPAMFLGLWALVVIGFFSLSRCKLVPYIAPAFPALALLVARYLLTGGATSLYARAWAGLAGLLSLAGVWLAASYGRAQTTLPPDEVRDLIGAVQGALVLGGVLLGASALRPRLLSVTAGLWLLFLVPPLLALVPEVAEYRRTPHLVMALPRPLPEEVRIAQWKSYDQSLSFYLHRRITLIDELDELEFGSTLGDHTAYFLQGAGSIRRLAQEGPLLLNLSPRDWPQVQRWGILHPVAANVTNLFVGNDQFFAVTGLEPWPDDAIGPSPMVLLPRRSRRAAGVPRSAASPWPEATS